MALEAVIKLGGSLIRGSKDLSPLGEGLRRIGRGHRVLIVPGGGELADGVRELDRRFHLSQGVSHWMAILAMDQMGLLLSDLIPGSKIVQGLREAEDLSREGVTPILLPSRLILQDRGLEESWRVTSDSIAARVAVLSRAGRLILAKDVDGIYTDDPKRNPGAKFIPRLEAQALLEGEVKGCVDEYLPLILLREGMDCYIVNGYHPERISDILEGRETLCTHILA